MEITNFLNNPKNIPQLHPKHELTDLLQNIKNYKGVLSTNDENFKNYYQQRITQYFENSLKNIEYPEDMVPDFSKNPENKYEINESDVSKGVIKIEEYRVKSKSGDEIIYAMAQDTDGNIYVHNVYDPRVGYNSYGILEKITNMGILVYKPIDYKEQFYGINKKYRGQEDGGKSGYVNINKLWQNEPIIKSYTENLIKKEL